MTNTSPNVLFIVSDEERRNDWLDGVLELPAHERLRGDGLDFSRYYTHTSPCSPSRASLYTGRYLAQHGVVDNVSFPSHTALDPAIPTLGSMLQSAGYTSAYLGKWHLAPTHSPDLAAHGYEDWQGNDFHFTGGPWSGRFFDPVVVDQAVDWLRRRPTDQPWFLTVALVNPHDVMWYPIDHLSYQDLHPEEREVFEMIRTARTRDVPLEAPSEDYPRLFARLPSNFDDDLHSKPEVQRAWRHVRDREHFVGAMDLNDHDLWLRQLDYYAYLHAEVDHSLGRLLAALDDEGIYDDTVVIYTSDHGDACGAHGLRAKLPCVYEEVMGVPLIVKSPTVSQPGTTTDALATHIDLAATIAALAGVDGSQWSLPGHDLSPVLDGRAPSVRDHVLFAQDSAQSELIRGTRYAVRGFFDGEVKYARYYGVGGGIQRDGTADPNGKVFDVDAEFAYQDHELYHHGEDPDELVNLAHHRDRRQLLRDSYERLLAYEAAEFAPIDLN